eukprot:m51a1_g9716 hypothetical protein (2423) ;mRNA; r:1421685-1430074
MRRTPAPALLVLAVLACVGAEQLEAVVVSVGPPDPLPPPPPNATGSDGGAFWAPGVAGERQQRGISVEGPVVVPLGPVQDRMGSTTRARTFVARALDPNRASVLLYPYPFTFASDNAGTVNLTDGAFVSTAGTAGFPDPTNTAAYFAWLARSTSIELARAQALYDVGVAVLQISLRTDAGMTDHTYESDSFCSAFYNYLYPKFYKCFRGMYDYQTYLDNNPTSHEQTSFVFLPPDNITAGALRTSTGENRFGVLFLPDIIQGTHETLAALLAPARAELLAFVSRGGVLVSSGKAALLLQSLGLVAAGTFDAAHTIRTPTSTYALVDGCRDADLAGLASDAAAEFAARTLCFSPPRNGAWLGTSLVSAPLMLQKDPSFTELAWYNTSVAWRAVVRHDPESGLDDALPGAGTPRVAPALMFKRVGRGHVVVHVANAIYSSWSYQWAYNAAYLAALRPLVLDNDVTGVVNRTIPALETLRLGAVLRATNYFSAAIAGPLSLVVWQRRGVAIAPLAGTSCARLAPPPLAPPLAALDASLAWNCSLAAGLAAFARRTWEFSVEITDNTVTQARDKVLLLYPSAAYIDALGAARTVAYGVTVDAATAGLLRADMNIDPSSQYPLWARGSNVDNVMNLENKEMTPALRVVHTSVVPLVSPLIDLTDQVKLAHHLALDTGYYARAVNRVADYKYPLSGALYDYLDFQLLVNRSNVLAASWDEAVRIARYSRAEVPGAGPALGLDASRVRNANYQTNNENDTFLLRQTNFAAADKVYEHGTQRMMAFLDQWDPAAARVLYGGAVPADKAAASDKTRGKKPVLFVRHDLYWWAKYPMPMGLSDTRSVVSMDRYAGNLACGNASRATVAGQFSSDLPGLVPREWTNAMLLDCKRPRIDPARVEALSGGQAQLIHYLVPITEPEIKQAGDLLGFGADNRYTAYPEVEFVSAYQALFDVLPANTRKGGEMVFTFTTQQPYANASAAIAQGLVTFSADQVAIYKTWADASGKLHVRFKRGNMPNEAFGQASHLQMYMEQTLFSGTVTASLDVYELVYDITKPQQACETWTSRTVTAQQLSLAPVNALRLPALKLRFAVRGSSDLNASVVQPYELLEPFVRYGLYEQELAAHRAVHGSAEFHPINEPCLVTLNDGFSAVTHIGTSSVPFREYLTTGTSLLIPAAPETGRVEWEDVWGRAWAQPVRSTIFEYPPIPPPLRNFVMTTTFEVLDRWGNRMLDWRSDDQATVRVQLKLLNNYPKWFEVTACKANEVNQLCGVAGKVCGKERLYEPDFYPRSFASPDSTDQLQYIKSGHNASYGVCFRDADVWLSGQKLTTDQRKGIQNATLCAKTLGTDDPNCEKLGSLPTLSRRVGNASTTWNYAKQVNDYWPSGYIQPNMWDLTHYDYDDNHMDKAYRYHMDNNLPHLGYSSIKPENLIAFPLFKGLGYQMVYNSSYSHAGFSSKRGWWSDNLQLSDHTLVAGQSRANTIAVGRSPLTDTSAWVDITQLHGADALVQSALRNAYTCLFNRRTPKVDPANSKVYFLRNVFENNVVPVDPAKGGSASWLSGFDCSGTTQYTQDTIGQYPNIVYTDTPRDWLYFAANLRGNAKENINVLYRIVPFSSDLIKFEGVAKVQDGGRFTYWNPANSRNSYLVVDNPVSTVMAIRNDVQLDEELLPSYSTTFNALTFHHYTITDQAETQRQWTDTVFIKHHGYGDFSVSVYVGDAGTSCIVKTPGQGRTRVKYTFNNNAGFDINLKSNAIESTEISREAINSYELMYNIVRAVRKPTAYNFLSVDVPAELRPHVSLAPSTDVVGVAGLFFDFDSINVATIRDGWKGDYYLDLRVLATFPDALRGRLHTLNVTLNAAYVDSFPGVGDPTGAHSYVVALPPIVFGVPYASGPNAGKIFWTSGYATGLRLQATYTRWFAVDGAAFVTTQQMEQLRACLGRVSNGTELGEFACLNRAWADLYAAAPRCTVATAPDGWGNVVASIGLGSRVPQFPVKVPAAQGADETELHVLVRTSASQIPSGLQDVSYGYRADFADWSARAKSTSVSETQRAQIKGAYLDLRWSVTLASASGLVRVQQQLMPGDDAWAIAKATLVNTGDSYAYNVNFTINLGANVTVVAATLAGAPGRDWVLGTTPDGNQTVSFFRSPPLAPWDSSGYQFLVSVPPDGRAGAGPRAAAPLNYRTLSQYARGFIDLTPSRGEKTVSQTISTPVNVYYSSDRADYATTLTGSGGARALALALKTDAQNVKNVVWLNRVHGAASWLRFATGTELSITVDAEQQWAALRVSQASDAAKRGGLSIDYMAQLTRDKVTALNTTTATIVAESNVYTYPPPSGSSSDKKLLLLLLLLIPGFAAIGVCALLFYKRRTGGSRGDDDAEMAMQYVKPDDSRLGSSGGGSGGGKYAEGSHLEAGAGSQYIMSGVKPVSVVDSR